jgi:hypothetical protein
MNDDDDTQDYITYQTYETHHRNEVLEEVAKEIEKMTVFGKDTIDSFVVFIREMKQ